MRLKSHEHITNIQHSKESNPGCFYYVLPFKTKKDEELLSLSDDFFFPLLILHLSGRTARVR